MTETVTTAKPSKESFSELLDQSFQEMTSIEGSVVSGTVISIEKDMILIDVGLKCEGRVPLREFGNNDEDMKIKQHFFFDFFVPLLVLFCASFAQCDWRFIFYRRNENNAV